MMMGLEMGICTEVILLEDLSVFNQCGCVLQLIACIYSKTLFWMADLSSLSLGEKSFPQVQFNQVCFSNSIARAKLSLCA